MKQALRYGITIILGHCAIVFIHNQKAHEKRDADVRWEEIYGHQLKTPVVVRNDK